MEVNINEKANIISNNKDAKVQEKVDAEPAAAIVELPPIQVEEVTVQPLTAKKKRLIRMVKDKDKDYETKTKNKGAAGIKSKSNPFLPENGLSGIERYFHHMPNVSAQVILTYGGRIILPKGSKYLSVNHIVDVCKMTACEIYRTASYLNYEQHTFVPFGKTAADIPIIFKFTPFKDEKTFEMVANDTLNQKYDLKDTNRSLWELNIVGPAEMKDSGIISTHDSFEFPKFYLFWSFHHCIADGLSGWAFIRKFMSKMKAENFQATRADLSKFPIVTKPPPLIDNLISTNWIELLPAYVDVIFQLFAKMRFKSSRLKNLITEKQVIDESLVLPDVIPPTATNISFFTFDGEFAEALRQNCRKNGTTIASAVIVAALCASRAVFAPKLGPKKINLPGYQAWVVTSSTRHLIPGSRLLEGAEKEKDPALMEFGGYGGSITSECFRFGKNSDLWERSRAVKKTLASSFLRMKLMNFLFRRQKLWKKLQAKVDIEQITRSYSVEVANLGSWNDPYAPEDAGRKDLATADWFAGSLNNSFHGARALFTVAVITINKTMSFSVAYDISTFSKADGDLFVAGIRKALTEMKEKPGRIKVNSVI